MPRLALALAILVAAARAGAEDAAPCPAGQAWDAAMAMCMLAAPPSPAGAPAHHHHHEGMSNAAMWDQMVSFDRCGDDAYYLFGMSMCMPRPTGAGHGWVMAMGSAYLVDSGETGPRGRHALSGPNWIMVDVGVDVATWNRLELDAMLTAELWTTPEAGYPELLQIGEDQKSGEPFLDAQHPHSSPIMGLTLTDVISFSRDKTRLLRVFFAPRGESTDGPIAFMHRPSAAFDPDAPLGHHIGQDVGHISSTILGAAFVWGKTIVEASTFHGHEPNPTQVDLPIGVPDSASARISQQLPHGFLVSGSFAYVHDPEGDPLVPHEWRVSVSAYAQHGLPHGWRHHTAAIWGAVTDYDRAKLLNSFALESTFSDDSNAIWSRLEVVQRTPNELEIVLGCDQNDPACVARQTDGQWVGAWTIGYTRRVVSLGPIDLDVGASTTASYLSPDFAAAYGGSTQFTLRGFVQARGMKHWFF